jgi:8-oxo-dGTP diphosphatase
LREFREVSADTRHLELFFLAGSFTGHLTIANIIGKGPDEEFIKEVRWLGSHEISSLTVFPQILGSEFWKHLKEGFASVRYLGVQNDQRSD